ncbi:alpha/beta fold hydrolase [Daejeonella sp. H1SJ63]|uniref:alpha/beta hydrolase n=1 Tax=Daejeonella sp. H1SJ63 TaxID=3034145 RepID=UPI0023EA7E74|nr:alpha/beta fold hydrolase [Daejeonella sp. H1SJ63]
MRTILNYPVYLLLFTGLFFNTTAVVADHKVYTSGDKEIGFNSVDPDKFSSHLRKRILKNMEKVMGKLPDRKNLPDLDIKITDSLKDNGFTRYSLNFATAENERLTVYLYVPNQRGTIKRLPAMLVLHGTHELGKGVVDGQGTRPNRAHARELAQRGYVVIAPDYPGFGELKDYNFETDRYQSGTMLAIFNHMRCVDLLQSRADVDPDRIGVIGHSLGGHNSMFVAAFDDRLKVTVSSCGWTQFENYDIGEAGSKRYGGKLGPWAQDRYMPLVRTKYNLDAAKLPFNFSDVISAIAPRAFFSVSPLNDSNFNLAGVKKGIAIAKKAYEQLGAEEMIQIRYPDAEHDFPVESRKEAYVFIDKILQFTPGSTELK